jgi:hypothetical protein
MKGKERNVDVAAPTPVDSGIRFRRGSETPVRLGEEGADFAGTAGSPSRM